ncbi:hypothetical protein EVAR_83974_1 [Eumeta japonica]|uniref:Uncharacterized protein n=1 Tax=Eumeta variegata TaxID=151549 RepID=A0A4C1VR25_EUMVA|nr:hypothetical protein EVAR_83974_1 [Eumeta japonica]
MLNNEVKSLQKNLELQKNELKCHYQKQLEDAVMAKLQEFQQQLDLAERHIENEARAKESSRIDMYNKQMAKVAEQHKLEINLLEEKQKEEIKLYRLQLAQSSEKISLLESKLESYRRRRGEIAAQLHGVMQSQWQQALKILTGATGKGRTSTTNASSDIPTHGNSTPIAQDYGPPKIPPFTMPLFAEHTISSSQESQREDSLPHGLNQDKIFNFENLSDSELQQYVKLLLTKPPNFLDGLSPPQGHLQPKNQHRQELKEEPTSDRPDKKSKRNLNTSKPPWKA